MDTPKLRVDFSFFGSIPEFNQITKFLGVEPDSTWRKGDRVGKTTLIEKEDGWRMTTGYVETWDTDHLIAKMLDRILPVQLNLQKLCEQMQLESELSIVIYIHDQTPSFCLSAKQVQQIASLRCSVDIDMIRC